MEEIPYPKDNPTPDLNPILSHPWIIYCKIYPNWGCFTPYDKQFERPCPGFLISALCPSLSLFSVCLPASLMPPLPYGLSLFYSPPFPNKPLALTLLLMVYSLNGIPWNGPQKGTHFDFLLSRLSWHLVWPCCKSIYPKEICSLCLFLSSLPP